MVRREYELVYDAKESAENILSGTPAADLQEVSLHGKRAFPDGDWLNMLILGENLTVLKRLVNCLGVKDKARLVYIDPPFSTGQEFRIGESRSSTISSSKLDKIAYRDELVGPRYLEFLRRRLIFLREILAEDGSIYVHVDSRVGHYVKILMDEVFGQNRFINDVTRTKCNPKNFPRKAYGNMKDMILFYSKTSDYIWNDPREAFTKEDVKRLFPKAEESTRRYTTNPLHAPGETLNGSTGKAWRGIYPPRGRHWRYDPEVLEELDRKGLIEWSSKGVPRKKIYADDLLGKGKKVQDVWEFKDPQFPCYPTEKNIEMLRMIVKTSSNAGDLVLDAFCGSGSTLVAAEELERRWIGIDNSSTSTKIALERLLEVRDCRFFKFLSTTS